MARVVYFVACSLDNRIARANGDVDWLFTDEDYGYEQFYSDVGVLVMGRVTYDLVRTFGEWPYHDRRTYVFSRSLHDAPDEDIEFIADNPAEFVNELATQGEKDIWVVGGNKLAKQLMQVDLIDRLILSIHPIILGGGITLFPDGIPETSWALRSWKTYDSGLVQLIYDHA